MLSLVTDLLDLVLVVGAMAVLSVGVCYNGGSNKRNPWQAFSYTNQTKTYIGSFPTEEEAATAVQLQQKKVVVSNDGRKGESSSSSSTPKSKQIMSC